MFEVGSKLGSLRQVTLSLDGLWMLVDKDKMLATAFLVGFLAWAAMILGKFILEGIQRRNLPPGPWAWPIVGSLFSLGPLPYKTLRVLAKKHGELMYLRLGSIQSVVVSSASMAKEVVTNHDLQFAYRPTKLFGKLLFNSKDIVHASNGPAWRHLRMICTSQFFTKKRLASYEATRTFEIHTLMKDILRKSSSEDCVVNLPFQLRNTSTNFISQMVFNKRLFVEGEESNVEDAKRYQKILKIHFSSYAIFVVSDYIPCLRFITKLQGIRGKFQQIADKIHKKMDEIIDINGHERRRIDANHKQDADRKKDFVDLLLETTSHDGKGTLDHETVRGVVMDMLFAGAETQSSTLEWAMAFLIRNPGVMKQVQAELDGVVGTERVVQESDLEKLPYLEAVVKEVMRVKPGAPIGINHESREPRQVAGHYLPAKTRLIFNIHAIHRDPSVYDRPDEFDPTRFLSPGKGNVPTGQELFQLMPYGAGRRICPGMPLAIVNIPHVLAHLVHSFDWSLPAGQDHRELDMTEKFDGVTSPRLHPLHLIPHPRKPAFLYK